MYESRQKMIALSGAFAQLVHKAQTVFQCNLRQEVRNVSSYIMVEMDGITSFELNFASTICCFILPSSTIQWIKFRLNWHNLGMTYAYQGQLITKLNENHNSLCSRLCFFLFFGRKKNKINHKFHYFLAFSRKILNRFWYWWNWNFENFQVHKLHCQVHSKIAPHESDMIKKKLVCNWNICWNINHSNF